MMRVGAALRGQQEAGSKADGPSACPVTCRAKPAVRSGKALRLLLLLLLDTACTLLSRTHTWCSVGCFELGLSSPRLIEVQGLSSWDRGFQGRGPRNERDSEVFTVISRKGSAFQISNRSIQFLCNTYVWGTTHCVWPII